MRVNARLKKLFNGIVFDFEHKGWSCEICESVRQKCGHTNVCVNIWGTPIQCQCFEGQVSKPNNDQGMRPRPNDIAVMLFDFELS